MTAVAERTQAKQLIDFVPADKISFIVRYIQSFATPTQKKRTSTINPAKKAAYEALLADAKQVSGKPLSLNGEEEVADITGKLFYQPSITKISMTWRIHCKMNALQIQKLITL